MRWPNPSLEVSHIHSTPYTLHLHPALPHPPYTSTSTHPAPAPGVDDEDRESHLKDVEHADDPMLMYMR